MESERAKLITNISLWVTAVLAMVASIVGTVLWVETKADRTELNKIQQDIEELQVLATQTKTSIEYHKDNIKQLQKLMNDALTDYESEKPISREKHNQSPEYNNVY